MKASPRAIWKATPLSFRIGLVIGFLVAVVGLIPSTLLTYPVEVTIAGADMSGRGAKVVTITDDGVAFAQTCVDTCDDLNIKFRHPSEPEGPDVSIRAADGHFITRGPGYVDGIFRDHRVYDDESFRRGEALARERDLD